MADRETPSGNGHNARAREGHERAPSGALLFETAWEVCNQVGGIYQVLRSKAATVVERWKDRYCLVGPYIESKAAVEFEPSRPGGWMARALKALEDEGLKVHHGRWLIPGNPRVLLVENQISRERLAEVKYRLWKDHWIESPAQDALVDGAIAFGENTRRLIERLWHYWTGPGGTPGADKPIVAHFHEWLGSLALPMLRHQNLPVGLVFTTHATLLGRYIASADDTFYNRLRQMDGEAEAARFNVRTQFRMEKACAHASHVFTTVSSVTAEECTQLLQRTPDVITPNGLNIAQYYAAHQMQFWHAEYKEAINQFAMGHFFPSYAFDLDRTIYVFTSGRYEPKNKGFDLCLETMARLNTELRSRNLGITVVFFIITSRPTRSLNPQSLEKRGVLNELRQVCQKITEDVGEKLYRHAAAGEKLHLDDLVDEYWRLRYKRTQYALKAHGLPSVVTHNIDNDAQDPVLNQIRFLNLINRKEDPVKIVYHPEFINPANPLWGIEYEQFVRGCHLGIFPSLYEPWGYTPLECMALGVPAVTSDLAGFGRYTQDHFIGHEELGVTVLRRRGRGYHDAAAELTQKLLYFCELRRRDRIALRNAVERFSWEFDWSRLASAYHDAHDLAIERLGSSWKHAATPAKAP
jgi:glycogen(starch) synthase